MHSKIIEIVSDLTKPMRKDKWATEYDLPDWFVGEIADYAADVDDDFAEEVKDSFVKSFGANCVREGNWITFNEDAKKARAERRYNEFVTKAKLLSTVTFEEFCGISRKFSLDTAVFELNNAYEDKYSTYVFDSANSELIPLNKWMRQMQPGERYFIGGVIDYHW